MKRPILYIILLILCGFIYAQDGDSYFKNQDYYNAARYYEVEAKKDASKYLNMAKSYFALKQFDKAIKAMESYKSLYASADISYANQFLELMRRDDEEIEMRPLSALNTNGSEYSPLISKDGNTLYFVGYDRAGGQGGEDIFISEKNASGEWGTPRPFEAFNTKTHETLKAISADNNAVILFGNYPGSFGSGDLFYSINVDGTWTYPCNLGGAINTGAWESQANLSADGRFMLFASNREGGQGEADIYVSELTDEGWTTPVNVGATINTSGDERTPFVASDGKTMYFSSDGHFGFGSYDLFVTKRLDDSWTKWSKPVNMGKYINTLSGDTYFSIPQSGSRGYIVGSGGLETNGSDDIFEFILPPSLRPEALFHVYGNVKNESDSAASVIIRYIDIEDGKEVAKTLSSSEDGSYAVSIPSYRKYEVIIDMKGYLYYSTILDLTDPSKYMKKRTFAEILGDEYELLAESKKRMDRNGVWYGRGLEAGQDVNVLQNFEELITLSGQYDVEADEMERLLRKARYDYLNELENQQEVIQDHAVTRIKIGAKFEVKNIFFDFGKASLRADSKQELDKLYDIMNRSEIVIEFGGHSDNVGSDEANLKLSQERVNSVKTYLVEKGIDEARIAAVGYGESQPVADNETEEGRQKNRRVELKITQLRLDREGAGEVTGTEEFDGLKEQSLFASKISVQEDLLERFRKAAEKGGLPSGSACGPKEETTTTVVSGKTKKVKNKKVKNKKTRVAKNKKQKTKKGGSTVTTTTPPTTTYDPGTTTRTTGGGGGGFLNSGGGGGMSSIDDVDDYIYGYFNPSFRTTGNEQFGNSLGAGFTAVNDELREFRMHYYFINPDFVKWTADLDWIWAIKLGMPLNIHYGLETTVQIVEETVNPDGGTLWLNLPIGLRYTIDMGDLKIAPELFTSFQLLASDVIRQDPFGRSRYVRLGVNARWKFIQGGLFINKGQYVDYTGIRAGFAF